MKTAKQLMTAKLITIESGGYVRDQVKHFLDNDIASAPVVTPLGELLGILTESVLIRAYLLVRINPNGNNSKIVHHKDILQKCTLIAEDTPMNEVIRAVMNSPIQRAYVQNNLKQLTGVISPKDILRFLVGEDNKAVLLKDELEEARKKLQDLEDKLKNAQELLSNYQSLYEDAPNMMHSVDEKGKITMANKKIHEVLGYEPGELVGKSIFDLYAKSCHGEAALGLKTILERGFHHSTYTTMMSKEGQKIRVDVASTALRDKYGNFHGTISASRVVDSDALLRALHGHFNNEDLEQDDLDKILDDDN